MADNPAFKRSPEREPVANPPAIPDVLPEAQGVEKQLDVRKQKSAEQVERADDRGAQKVEAIDRTAEQLAQMKIDAEIWKTMTPDQQASAIALLEHTQPTATPLEKKFWNPATWSPEDRAKAAQIAVIGTVVVGGLLLTKWLWSKTKNAAEHAKEKAGKAWGIVKYGLLAGALTVGGYFGYTALREAHEKMKMVTDAKKELEKLQKLSGNARAMADKRIKELEEIVKGNGNIPSESKNSPNLTTENQEGNAEKIALTAEQKELIKAGKRGLIASAVVHLYEDPDWKIGNISKATQIADAIKLNAQLPMANILSSTTLTKGTLDVSIPSSFTIAPDDRESRTKAAALLITFCADQKDKVISMLSEKEGVSQDTVRKRVMAMPLDVFMETVASYYSILPELLSTVGEANGDTAVAINTLKKSFLQDNAALREAVDNFVVDMNLDEEELSQFSTAQLLKIIAQEIAEGVSVKTRLNTIQRNPQTVEEKVLHTILERIASGQDDTAKFMIPCFQGIFPEKEHNVSEEAFIQRYLESRMSVAQAVRFFLYKEMIKGGNSAGLVMMQVEVLKLIADSDMTFLNYKKNQAVIRIMEGLLKKEAVMLADEYKKYNIQVSPAVFEAAQQSLGSVFKIGAGGFFIYLRERWGTLQALANEHRTAAAGIGSYLVARKSASIWMQSTINAAERAIIEQGLKGGSAADLIEPRLGGRILRSVKIPLVGRGETLQKWIAARKVLRENNLPLPGSKAVEHLSNSLQSGLTAIKNSPHLKEVLAQTGGKLDDVLALVSKVDFPAPVLQAFTKTKGGLTMLVNASKAGAPALEYLAKLGSVATRIGPALGKAALGIDALVCALEMTMNKIRIEDTDNQALKDLYAMRDRVSMAQAAAGTAMGTAWIAVGWAPTAAAVSASTFLPAVIGLAAAKYSYDRLEETSEAWLSQERDWAKKTPGELRQRLDAMAPGTQTYWQQAAGGTRAEVWLRELTSSREENMQRQEEVFRRIEQANGGARFQMTRAYLAKMTDIAPNEGETNEQFKNRFAKFQTDQAVFIGEMTQGDFNLTLSDTYRNAHTHAELRALCDVLKNKKESHIIPVEIADKNGRTRTVQFDLATYDNFTNPREIQDGVSQLAIINAYQRQQRGLALASVAVVKDMAGSSPDARHNADTILQRTILAEVRNDMALCDQKLREADLKGLNWTGGEEVTRATLRYAISVELRKLLRAESDRLQAKTPVASVEDMEESIHRVQSFLQRNPAEHEQLLAKGTYTLPDNLTDTSDSVFTMKWNLQNLYVYPPSGTTSA